MSRQDYPSLKNIPESILKHLKDNNLTTETFALYFEPDSNIQEILKNNLHTLTSRSILQDHPSENEETISRLRSADQIIIDDSIKLWPRLIGNFSVEDLEGMLRLGIFYDIKIFGHQEFHIEDDHSNPE